MSTRGRGTMVGTPRGAGHWRVWCGTYSAFSEVRIMVQLGLSGRRATFSSTLLGSSLVHPWFAGRPKMSIKHVQRWEQEFVQRWEYEQLSPAPAHFPPSRLRYTLAAHTSHTYDPSSCRRPACCLRQDDGWPALSPLPPPPPPAPPPSSRRRPPEPEGSSRLHASSALGKACHIRIVASSAPVAYVAPPDAERFAKTNVSAARSVCGEGCS